MLYQVMIRARARKRFAGYVTWEPFAEPTRDPFAAMQLVRQANQRQAEALVVQAEDADDLAELIQHMRAQPLLDAPTVTVAEPVSSAPPKESPTHEEHLSLADELLAAWDDQRWEIERGAGGDHDTPYRFTLPVSYVELRAWLRLMARYHRVARETPKP